MHLRVSFVPGRPQAKEAARYFTRLANESVQGLLADLEPHQYRIEHDGLVLCTVRIWCDALLADRTVLSVMALMHALQNDIRHMLIDPRPDAIIPGIMAQWLEAEMGDQTVVIEKLGPKNAFSTRERVSMAIAVSGGRLSMVSSRRFIFTEQEPGLFGLAVGTFGSYLFERLHHGDPVNAA